MVISEMQNYENYTDQEIIEMMESVLDLDEVMFFILPELAARRPDLAKQECLKSLERDFGYQEYFVSSSLETLYKIDGNCALEFISENYPKLHLYTLGEVLSELAVDSSIYKENPNKEALIKTLIAYLKTLNKQQISEIEENYNWFKESYKKIW